MIAVRVNGAEVELPESTTVEEVVTMCAASRSGIAVALNGDVVSRSAWGATPVNPGDELELLTAAQGG